MTFAEYCQAYAERNSQIVPPEIRMELQKRGLTIDGASPEFWQTSMATLMAHVVAYGEHLRRQSGDVRETPRPVASSAPKLSEALKSWREGGGARGEHKPSTRTAAEAAQVVRYFIDVHGDLHLDAITREKARQFRDVLAKAPKNASNRHRKLSLPKLVDLKLDHLEMRSAETINKLLGLLSAVITNAMRGGHLDHAPNFVNPFDKNMRLASRGRNGGRAIFERSDLRAIFGSPIYTHGARPAGGGGEAAFWFPLIGLLSGMRLDEIGQLRICDLKQDEESEAWYFDIGTDGGRLTKTESSIRKVPVHPELIRIGLFTYRSSLMEAGANADESLWPAVSSARGLQRTASWSKWFVRHLRQVIGITDTDKVFHSFRHTFKRMTRDAELPEELHDALTGHAGLGVGRRYGRGVSLKPLVAGMEKVLSPVDFCGIQWIR